MPSMIVSASRSRVRRSTLHKGHEIIGRQYFVFAWKKSWPSFYFGLLELYQSIQGRLSGRREGEQVARQLSHYPEGQQLVSHLRGEQIPGALGAASLGKYQPVSDPSEINDWDDRRSSSSNQPSFRGFSFGSPNATSGCRFHGSQ